MKNGAEVNATNKAGKTPLHLATEAGLRTVCAVLLEANASLGVQGAGEALCRYSVCSFVCSSGGDANGFLCDCCQGRMAKAGHLPRWQVSAVVSVGHASLIAQRPKSARHAIYLTTSTFNACAPPNCARKLPGIA